MTTSDRDDIPRDGRGKWRKTVASVDRDAKAALLSAQGWTFDRIAAELGYGDRQAAHRAVKQALLRLSSVRSLADMREQLIIENNEARRILWRTARKPPQSVDRLGRPCEDSEGRPIPDELARQGALAGIGRFQDRLARLVGADAPRRSVHAAVDLEAMSLADAREWAVSQGVSEDDAYCEQGMIEGSVESS